MTNIKHRVVVQLNDIQRDDDRKIVPILNLCGAKTMANKSLFLPKLTRTPIQVEVDVVDATTLGVSKGVNSPLRLFRFDNVGKASSPNIRTEINNVMDKLLIQHQNTSMVRFSVIRECQLNLLCRLFVTEIDQRLQSLHAVIHTIKLEYYDVSKYDVVNVLNKAPQMGGRNRRRQRLRSQFSNTLELLKWLQTEYIQLWNVGTGHECFDLQIIYSDSQRHIQKVKFSLMLLYVGKMDSETSKGLQEFLHNLNGKKRAGHSMITACLIEYFKVEERWWTWLFFDIPLAYNNLFTEELVQLAVAAYHGVKSLNSIEEDFFNFNFESNTHLSDNCSFAGMKSIDSHSVNRTKFNEIHTINRMKSGEDNHSMRTYSTQDNFNESPRKSISKFNANKSSESFSSKDFNSLSAWYCRIDEKFLNVVSAMERYYNEKYGSKIFKMCVDIKQLVRNNECIDDQRAQLEDVNFNINSLQSYYDQYKISLNIFRSLMKEVENTNYADLLKVYLKTKSFELSQHAVNVKVKNLQKCQTHVSGTIKEELVSLNNLKKSSLHSRQTCNLKKRSDVHR